MSLAAHHIQSKRMYLIKAKSVKISPFNQKPAAPPTTRRLVRVEHPGLHLFPPGPCRQVLPSTVGEDNMMSGGSARELEAVGVLPFVHYRPPLLTIGKTHSMTFAFTREGPSPSLTPTKK
jgi:hypothetical protein